MKGFSAQVSRTSNNITLLRHFAALFVLINHSFDLLDRSDEEPISVLTDGAISLSRIGLIFFFFMSGMLVTQSLFNSAGIKHFLWKRILRIFPALIVLTFLTVFILGPAFTTLPIREYFMNRHTWEYFFGSVSLIRLRFILPGVFDGGGVNGSLWSLPIEFRFYVLLAVFFMIGVLKNKKWYLIFPAFFLFIFLVFPYLTINPVWTYLTPYISWAVFFFLGSFVFFIRTKIKLDFRILLAMIAVWYFTRNIEIIGRIFEIFAFCYLALFLSYRTPVLGKDFFAKNDYSYSIYIYAFPIQKMLLNITSYSVSPLGLMTLTMIVLIPFCWFSWRFIERPALKQKDLFRKIR